MPNRINDEHWLCIKTRMKISAYEFVCFHALFSILIISLGTQFRATVSTGIENYLDAV